METILIRDEIATSLNPDNLLTALAMLIGDVNFNKYGIKDNIGMVPVTDIFIDSFIVKRRSFLDQLDVDPVADLRKLANSVGMAEIAILPIGNNKFKISSPDYHIDAVTNFIKIISNTYFTLNCIMWNLIMGV